MSSRENLSHYFTDQVWSANQVIVAVLGICSSLGVTNSLQVALTMGAAVTFSTAGSCLFVSLLRKYTPDSVRMIAQLAVISLFVIIVDQFMQAYLFALSKQLSVFVGLIITNCILMGRTEGMAKNVPPLPALLDGLGAGVGYSLVLAIIAVFREVFGFGTLFGLHVIPASWYADAAHPDRYQNSNLMVLAPAAFFLVGILIMFANRVKAAQQRT